MTDNKKFTKTKNNKSEYKLKQKYNLSPVDTSLLAWLADHMNTYVATKSNPIYTDLCSDISKVLKSKGSLDDIIRLRIKRIKYVIELGGY